MQPAESSRREERSSLEVKGFTGQWSRNSGSMDVPARMDTSGQMRSEHTVKNGMMTNWRRQRFRPGGFVTKEVAGTAWLLSKAGIYE